MSEENTQTVEAEVAKTTKEKPQPRAGQGKTLGELNLYEKAWIAHMWGGIQYKDAKEVMDSSTEEEQTFILMRSIELRDLQEQARKRQEEQEGYLASHLETQKAALEDSDG